MTGVSHRSVQKAGRHHAVHRMFAATMLGVMFFVSLGLMGVVWRVLGASRSTVFSLTISDPSQNPPSITSSPSTVILGSSFPPASMGYLKTPPEDLQDEVNTVLPFLPMSLSILTDEDVTPEGGSLSSVSPQLLVARFSDARPVFKGGVGVPYAVIFLEVHSDPTRVITASVTADAHGNWRWQPARAVDDGPHVLYITVFDPKGEIKLGSMQLEFEIVSSVTEIITHTAPRTETKPRTSVQLPPRMVDTRTVLFDIRTKVIGASSSQ